MKEYGLTIEEINAMGLVVDGADVLAYHLAKALRSVERKYPELVDICDVQGQYTGVEQLPYFGAILTDEGKRALTTARERMCV